MLGQTYRETLQNRARIFVPNLNVNEDIVANFLAELPCTLTNASTNCVQNTLHWMLHISKWHWQYVAVTDWIIVLINYVLQCYPTAHKTVQVCWKIHYNTFINIKVTNKDTSSVLERVFLYFWYNKWIATMYPIGKFVYLNETVISMSLSLG